MPAAAVDRHARDRNREQNLNGQLEPRWDSARPDDELAAVVGDAEQPSRSKPTHGRKRVLVAGKTRKQATDNREYCKNDTAGSWCSSFLLVCLGQLFLDDLAGFDLAQRSDRDWIEDERDRKRDNERPEVEDQAVVSSFTTSSRCTPCDALTSTRSPGRARARTHSAAL